MTIVTHHDYAEEAESAQRVGAWPQAAALWRRAHNTAQSIGDTAKHNLCQEYEEAAERCAARTRTNQQLERIAREELNLNTLEKQNVDNEDIHSLAVWEIQNILTRAYQAGFEAGLAGAK